MRKIFSSIKSYFILVNEFAAGGQKKNRIDKLLSNVKKSWIYSIVSYFTIVNEMGAGGKKTHKRK